METSNDQKSMETSKGQKQYENRSEIELYVIC